MNIHNYRAAGMTFTVDDRDLVKSNGKPTGFNHARCWTAALAAYETSRRG